MEFTNVNRSTNRNRRLQWVELLLLSASLCCWNSVASAQEDHRLKPRETQKSLPLPTRTSASAGSDSETVRSKPLSSSNSLLNLTISLTLIVGTLVLVGRWMKRNGFRGVSSLPIEAFEILGKRMIDSRTAVHLVRCGSRILVLGVGSEGVRTLSEIDDPGEVEKLIEFCQEPTKGERDSKATAARGSSASKSPLVQRAFVAFFAVSLFLSSAPTVHAQVSRWGNAGVPQKGQADAGPGAKPRVVQQAAFDPPNPIVIDPQQLVSPQQLGLSLKMLALMTVFSLAPSILMMTTCFVRFIVVLGLLRQALGTQQGPPTQVMTAICMFLTFLVMSPVWQRCYQEGIRPYTNPAQGEPAMDETTALTKTIGPVRGFMSQQIDKAGNSDAVWMLLDYQQTAGETPGTDAAASPQSYDDVPFTVLAPAYLLSELKVGFLIGFQLFLPFVVIDLVVAVLLASLGLTMLPPSMVSLPFKLLLFVLIDGWFLTVGMLLESVKVV